MDDHLYMYVLNYGGDQLIGRLQREFDKTGKLKDCESYGEAQDFVKVLNLIGKYGGYAPMKVSDLIDTGQDD
jgi:hypothetical protein